VLLVWVVGGLSFYLCVDVCFDMCLCPLPQRPLVLSIGGVNPTLIGKTLKGKPLGRNPNRVNPHVYPYSSLDANDSHLRLRLMGA
jgi:hypothetical protein